MPALPTQRKSLAEYILRVPADGVGDPIDYNDRCRDHHRYKAAGEFLSQQGWLVWQDEKYVVGRGVNGVYQKGQATEFEASDYLRCIAAVKEEKGGGGEIHEGERRGEQNDGHSIIRFNPHTIPD